jgi:hypothetical protein
LKDSSLALRMTNSNSDAILDNWTGDIVLNTGATSVIFLICLDTEDQFCGMVLTTAG